MSRAPDPNPAKRTWRMASFLPPERRVGPSDRRDDPDRRAQDRRAGDRRLRHALRRA